MFVILHLSAASAPKWLYMTFLGEHSRRRSRDSICLMKSDCVSLTSYLSSMGGGGGVGEAGVIQLLSQHAKGKRQIPVQGSVRTFSSSSVSNVRRPSFSVPHV